MRTGSLISAFCFVLAISFSCRNGNPDGVGETLPAAVMQCVEEFHISGLACLIAENGQLILEHGKGPDENLDESSRKAIVSHFIAPLLVDRMIGDSIVHERDSITPWLKAKDLIFVPADYYERDRETKDPMQDRLLNLIQRHASAGGKDTHAHAGESNTIASLAEKLQLHHTPGMQGLFHDLWQISTYFDQTHPEFIFSSKVIYNVFPTWYTRGLSAFFGWKVLKFQGETVLWDRFVAGSVTILLIKFVDKGIFAAAGYTTGSLPQSRERERDDLLQFPLALSLFKAIYLKNVQIDYRQPQDSLYALLEKVQRPPFGFIYLHDLLAHARLYEQAGRKAWAGALYSLQARLMKDTLLVRYENKPALAEINYVSDNLRATVPFSMDRPGWVQLFAGGQLTPPHDYEGEPYQFDNVQLFINDHVGEKDNSWLNTHMFQFNYGSDSARVTHALFAIGDPADTSYLVEVRIGWKLLNPAKHAAGRQLLANILVGDCDLEEDRRKSVLSWTVGAKDNFGDEKKYGRIVLAQRSGKTAGNRQYAIRTSYPPHIDGKAEDCWDKAPWSSVGLPYIGSVSRPDNAARFKALYDDSCLYLLFDVTDNCKNRYGFVTADKCWIEDAASGLPVWKMNGDTTDTYPDFSDRRRIFLPAGKYLLKYVSDKGNSYEHWYGRPPANGIYGAVVYPAEN